MALLVSSVPGSTTGVPLSQNAFWRLQLGVAAVEQTPALSLAVRYPPGGPADIIALARSPVPVAQSPDEVQRIADVGLLGGSLDRDLERITEAYQMFKNNPRTPSGAALEEAINGGHAIVRAYWGVRDWLLSGCEDLFQLTVLENQEIRGIP
jgi:hypothetical protein